MSRSFASKKDDDDPSDPKKSDIERFEEQKAKKKGKGVKPAVNEFWEETDVHSSAGAADRAETDLAGSASEEEVTLKPKRKRRSKAEIEAERVAAAQEKVQGYQNEKMADGEHEPTEMYTLKFNSPILPFSRFPLTQNKYIQDFLRSYEEDKPNITKVIGVHFEKNNNSNAEDAVGIEIEIIKKNNITIVESMSNRRYKVVEFNSGSNFCKAVPYDDEDSIPLLKTDDSSNTKVQDLLQSEVFELKNIWFLYNKKINSVLVILP